MNIELIPCKENKKLYACQNKFWNFWPAKLVVFFFLALLNNSYLFSTFDRNVQTAR